MDEQEFKAWQAVTESSRNRWTEDEIFRLNGRGLFYYIGGENGVYIRIENDGTFSAGDYEGAVPHIGDAFFSEKIKKKYETMNDAFKAAAEAGGIKFLTDMFMRPVSYKPKEKNQMNFSKERVNKVKEQYPVGTRIELRSFCNDEQGMPAGLRGTVTGIDDQPALLMRWDNGSGLSLLPFDDSFRMLTAAEAAEEQLEEQESEVKLV
ncbi:MAG: DUF4314 domain-containing protein [Clostridiales Family XIII bacterium]|nr:DUF4314 domain-containing protein [Clostridiales Family XIII bacterium]